MDNREKIYEHGGELGNVQDLFEITANHVHYLMFTGIMIRLDLEIINKFLLVVKTKLIFSVPHVFSILN